MAVDSTAIKGMIGANVPTQVNRGITADGLRATLNAMVDFGTQNFLGLAGDTVTGALTLGNALNMANGQYLNFADTGGGYRNVMTLSGANVLFGDVNNNITGGSNLFFYAKNNHNFLVNNNLTFQFGGNYAQLFGTTPSFYLNNGTTGYSQIISSGASGNTGDFYFTNFNTGKMYFRTSAVWSMPNIAITIFPSGNVGFGTTSTDAGYRLDVAGASRINGTFDIYGATSLNGNANFSILKNDTTVAGLAFVDSVNNYNISVRRQQAGEVANANSGVAFFGYQSGSNNLGLVLKDSGQVGVGIHAPNAAALLDLTSTVKGFLPPRMTSTQRDAIASPPSGLVIFNSTTNKLNVRGASAWEAVTSA